MIFWIVALTGHILSTVISQSLLDFFMILMLLGWLISSVKKKSLRIEKKDLIGIEWAFLLYFVVVCLGYAFNAASDAPWQEGLLKFTWIFNLYILIHALKQIRIRQNVLIKIIVLGLLIPTLYSFIGYWRGFDPITGRENMRIMGFVNSATYHAHGNAIFWIFLASLLFVNWRNINVKLRIAACAFLLLLGLSILLTFTRGIWISIFLCIAVMLAIHNLKKAVVFASAIFIFLVGAYFSWPKFHARIQNSMSTTENSERLNLFKVNVEIWQEYPWLGIGYGENIRRNQEYWARPEWNLPSTYMSSHAHNQILNVMSTTGILGLIPFVCFLWFFLSRNWSLLRKTDRKSNPFRYALLFACLWGQIEFLLGCLSDVSFEYAKIRAIVLFVWALVIVLERCPKIVIEELSE